MSSHKTWFMVSSGPNRAPTGMALHPDEAKAARERNLVRYVRWDSGRESMSVYVEAQTYEAAIAKAGTMFAAAWKEAGT